MVFYTRNSIEMMLIESKVDAVVEGEMSKKNKNRKKPTNLKPEQIKIQYSFAIVTHRVLIKHFIKV